MSAEPDERPSEAIRSNQKQSEAIRRAPNQMSGPQKQSEAISDHQRTCKLPTTEP